MACNYSHLDPAAFSGVRGEFEIETLNPKFALTCIVAHIGHCIFII